MSNKILNSKDSAKALVIFIFSNIKSLTKITGNDNLGYSLGMKCSVDTKTHLENIENDTARKRFITSARNWLQRYVDLRMSIN